MSDHDHQDTDLTDPHGEAETLREERDALRAEVERLEEELYEAKQAPWPAWAEQILRKLRKYGVDPGDEIDLAEEFDEWIDSAIENEVAALNAEVRAADLWVEVTQLRAEVERLQDALTPFARAGALFPGAHGEAEFDQCIYKPAAGNEYSICGDDLRRARDALKGARHDADCDIRSLILPDDIAPLLADRPPTPAEAMRCPEVMALVEAMRGAIEAIDAAYDGPDDNWRYSTRERAAISALEQSVRHE